MQLVHVYLNFPGTTEEAFRYYETEHASGEGAVGPVLRHVRRSLWRAVDGEPAPSRLRVNKDHTLTPARTRVPYKTAW